MNSLAEVCLLSKCGFQEVIFEEVSIVLHYHQVSNTPGNPGNLLK